MIGGAQDVGDPQQSTANGLTWVDFSRGGRR